MVRLRWHFILEVAASEREEDFYIGFGASLDLLEVRFGRGPAQRIHLLPLGPCGGVLAALCHGSVVVAILALGFWVYLRIVGGGSIQLCVAR